MRTHIINWIQNDPAFSTTRIFRLYLTIVLIIAASSATTAQLAQTENQSATKTTQSEDQASTDGESSQEVPPEFQSPRATLTTFFSAFDQPAPNYEQAIACLDLSEYTRQTVRERGKDLAYRLKVAIDKLVGLIDLEADVPQEPETSSYSLFKKKDLVIELQRQQNGRWLFSQATAASIDELYSLSEDMTAPSGVVDVANAKPLPLKIRDKMPAWLKKDTILLEGWQWLGLFLLIFIGFIVERLATFIFNFLVSGWLKQIKVDVDPKHQYYTVRALGILVMTGLWFLGLNLLNLPLQVHNFLQLATRALACLALVLAAYRLVDVAASFFEMRALKTRTKFDDILVPLFRKSLKVLVVVFGLVFIAQNLEIKIWSLLTGLGIGGLAFAFAARDSIANFFGSIMILIERPFGVGDWVVVNNVEGSVEELGFRSTRIRTFYNSLITVPNSQLVTSPIDNMGMRRYRRFKSVIHAPFETPPEKLAEFCEGVRQIIRDTPAMRQDYFHIYVNDFGEFAMQILIYVFFEVPDWSEELNQRHLFILNTLELARDMDLKIAIPERRIHMAPHIDGDPSQDPSDT